MENMYYIGLDVHKKTISGYASRRLFLRYAEPDIHLLPRPRSASTED
jgi:hypothetical protein